VGKLVHYILNNGLTVYSAHTNLDIANGGVNTALARAIGLTELAVMKPMGWEKYVKLVVFVPEGYIGAVHQAVSAAGAGWIGNYSHCAFRGEGTGMFKPLEGANPFIGGAGELSFAEESRLETIVPHEKLTMVLQAMLQAHPYEEVAYDLYPLENRGPAYGLGIVGQLSEPLTFRELATLVKTRLNLEMARIGGDMGRIVEKVAVCGGAGARFWPQALGGGADVYITGDVGHHDARDMQEAGLNFIDAGHHGTEAVVLPLLQAYLQEECDRRNLPVELYLSQRNPCPFTFV
jgi:dinuclear metal center YbgI/SA1388 family protein